jgi:hypothetical protein
VHVLYESEAGTASLDAGKLGESSFDACSLPAALDAAWRARLVKNKPWTLPPPQGGARAANVRAVDPKIVEAADERVRRGRTIEGAVRAR